MPNKLNIQFTPASNDNPFLRLAIAGPSGSGKTWTALAVARYLGQKVALIDTENKSASKYKGIFTFDKFDLPLHSPANYVACIEAAERAGYDVLIIDSLSHAWTGRGGALEMVDDASARYRNNSWAAWREVTPEHNELVDAMLQADLHIIATMRTRTEWLIDESDGKKTPIKIGLEPVQRKGIEYEFDIIADLDMQHRFIVSKSRCPDLDRAVIKEPDGLEIAETVIDWLAATDVKPTAQSVPERVEGQPVPTAAIIPVRSLDPERVEGPDLDIDFYLAKLTDGSKAEEEEEPNEETDGETEAETAPTKESDEPLITTLVIQANQIGTELYTDEWPQRAAIISRQLFKQEIKDIDAFTLNQANTLLTHMQALKEKFALRDAMIQQIQALAIQTFGEESQEALDEAIFALFKPVTSIYKLSLKQLDQLLGHLIDLAADAHEGDQEAAQAENNEKPAEPTRTQLLHAINQRGIELFGNGWTEQKRSEMAHVATDGRVKSLDHLSGAELAKLAETLLSFVPPAKPVSEQPTRIQLLGMITARGEELHGLDWTAELRQELAAWFTSGQITSISDLANDQLITLHSEMHNFAPAKAPVGSNPVEPTVEQINQLGAELYGDDWPARRRTSLRTGTEGRTTSLNKLTSEERTRFYQGLVSLQTKRLQNT